MYPVSAMVVVWICFSQFNVFHTAVNDSKFVPHLVEKVTQTRMQSV